MDVREHFYSDDPRVGPADVRTTLKGVEYFFLGNGHLQAAIQLCSAADGTPLGLLLMHPERLGNKRQALTFDPKLGLQPTMVGLVYDGASFYPAAGGVSGGWSEIDGVPAVRLEWSTGDFSVRETFLFPDRQTPRLARRIAVRNLSGKYPELVLKTQSREINLQKRIELAAGQEKETALVYELIGREEPFQLAVGWATENEAPLPSAVAYWEQASWAHFNLELLDHLFRVATVQSACRGVGFRRNGRQRLAIQPRVGEGSGTGGHRSDHGRTCRAGPNRDPAVVHPIRYRCGGYH